MAGEDIPKFTREGRDFDENVWKRAMYIYDTSTLDWKRWDGRIDTVVNGDLIVAVDDLEDLQQDTIDIITVGNAILTTIDTAIDAGNVILAAIETLLGGVPSSTNLEGVGDLAVGTSEVEIAISGTPKEIRIRADQDNTGEIFIGKTGVLSNGTNDFVRLDSGDEVTIDYDDTTNALYAISDTAAQSINIGALL